MYRCVVGAMQTTMRIRKPHRNTTVRVAPVEENVRQQAIDVESTTLLKVWEEDHHPGDGRPKSSTTTTTTTPELPASTGLESLSSLSRHASPGVSMQRRALEDGSNLSVDQLWQVQDGGEEQTPRHYVRRCSNVARKEGIREEEMSPELGLRPPAVGASKRKLPTQQDSEEVHPSAAPEGSLLQTLYLQLLAAGSEGITLRDLFTSFKKQTALLSFDSDWKEQVRSHLKSNPHFDEVKGHYLLCTQLLQRQSLKHTPAGSLKRPYMGVHPRTTNSSGRHVRPSLKFTDSASTAAVSSVEKNHEGVQTRRKAYEKTIEAVLTESAMEFERMQQQASSSLSPQATPIPAASDVVTTAEDSQDTPLPATSRKRKTSSETEELDGSKTTIRGSLQALQAKILAETGQQLGAPCARKDDARKWRCPLMAMEGHTLCEHHKTLQVRKRVRKQAETTTNRSSRRRSGEKRESRKLERRSKPDVETETTSSPEKDGNNNVVAGGGAHAVEALVDLQAQPRQAISLNTVPAEDDDDDDAHQADEEAESKVVINNQSGAHTDEPMSVAQPVVVVAHRHIYYEKAIPGSLKALQAKILSESGGQSGVRCARKDGSNDSARKWQCPLNAMEGHTLCEHHNFLKERKRARYAAAAHTRIGVRKRRGPSNKGSIASTKGSIASNKGAIASNNAVNRPEKRAQVDEVAASLAPKPVEKDRARSSIKDSRRHDEKIDLNESTDTDDLEPVNATKDDDNNDGDDDGDKANAAEQVMPRSTPKRWYVAAKKTAAVVEVVKEKSQEREASPLIRPPTIPPLPAMYGVRRKAVKNRSLLSL